LSILTVTQAAALTVLARSVQVPITWVLAVSPVRLRVPVHPATLLPDGHVLLTGGRDTPGGAVACARKYGARGGPVQ